MRPKPAFILAVFGLLLSLNGAAAEFTDGAIRLVLDESNGRFSLYAPNSQGKPVALFSDIDARTSFLSVIVNDRSYKMGDSMAFKVSLGGDRQTPSLIYESSTLIVTMEFSFLRTANSSETNGVSVGVILENKGDRQINAGARFLLDTYLGEKSPGFPITTNQRDVVSEILLTGTDSDYRWTDRNDTISLTGSIDLEGEAGTVHFANWKKLTEVSWKASYQPGRNFNFLPYSLNDTAICYYFEPRPLDKGQKRGFGFSLAVNDESGFPYPGTSSIAASLPVRTFQPNKNVPTVIDLTVTNLPEPNGEDLAAINSLLARIDTLIESGTATDEELVDLELALNKLRAKYGADAHER